jgi:hypothetical protein
MTLWPPFIDSLGAKPPINRPSGHVFYIHALNQWHTLVTKEGIQSIEEVEMSLCARSNNIQSQIPPPPPLSLLTHNRP